jgi:hypothetical protein
MRATQPKLRADGFETAPLVEIQGRWWVTNAPRDHSRVPQQGGLNGRNTRYPPGAQPVVVRAGYDRNR